MVSKKLASFTLGMALVAAVVVTRALLTLAVTEEDGEKRLLGIG